MFRAVPLYIIRSFSLYAQQWYMSYRFIGSLRARSWSCSQAVSKTVWHIPLLCLQWRTPDDGQRNCPKHVEFYSRDKFEKLVHLVGFIRRNLSRCTVTWTSSVFCYFVLWLTNAQLFHKLTHSYMFRHYCFILRELAINTFPSYASISNAAVSNTIHKTNCITKNTIYNTNCITNSCIWNTSVTWQDINYKLPENDTIVSKHVGVW